MGNLGSGMCGENWVNVRPGSLVPRSVMGGNRGVWVGERPGSLVPRSVMGENRGIWVGECERPGSLEPRSVMGENRGIWVGECETWQLGATLRRDPHVHVLLAVGGLRRAEGHVVDGGRRHVAHPLSLHQDRQQQQPSRRWPGSHARRRRNSAEARCGV